jgi:alpha-tubulin suppressor-like RCC1 family protein
VGDRIDRSSLVPVSFLLSGKVTQVAAGATFSVAVTDSGQLFTWGSNEFGQLGVGDLRDRLSPELVAGNASATQSFEV